MSQPEPAEDIARRFGVDVRHVRRRMKLGQLADPIREALREGEIKLNVAAAFTVGTLDQQLNAWAELSGRCPPRHMVEWSVRTLLNRRLTHVGDRLCRFVGLDAYAEAGGCIIEDLFDDHRYIEDRALLQRLATEKLETVAEEERQQGWKWAEASLDGNAPVDVIGQEQPADVPLSPEMAEERASVNARIAALESEAVRTGDDENELHRLYSRLAELSWYFPPEVMARSRLRRTTRRPPAPPDLRIAITRVRPHPAVPSTSPPKSCSWYHRQPDERHAAALCCRGRSGAGKSAIIQSSRPSAGLIFMMPRSFVPAEAASSRDISLRRTKTGVL